MTSILFKVLVKSVKSDYWNKLSIALLAFKYVGLIKYCEESNKNVYDSA